MVSVLFYMKLVVKDTKLRFRHHAIVQNVNLLSLEGVIINATWSDL
jgi:hypothetical protein